MFELRVKGFTLIELVVVILLAGILSAYAVVQWPSDAELKLPGQTRLFVSHIRQVQLLAMQWGEPLRLNLNANSYSVSCVNASAVPPCNINPVIDPVTRQTFVVNLDADISLSGVPSIDFDSLGRPVGGGVLLSSNPAAIITLSTSTASRQISLQPISGFIQAG